MSNIHGESSGNLNRFRASTDAVNNPDYDPADKRSHHHTMKNISSSLSNHELPSTQDAVNVLEHIKTSSAHQQMEGQVSSTGKRLLSDVDNILSKGQKMMLEKNKDEYLQKMLYHSKKATDLSNREKLKMMKGQGGELKMNMSDVWSKFINVVKLIASSGEFRSAVKSLISVLMDIFKYNTGGNVNKSSLSDGSVREELHEAMHGEKNVRDAAHDVVDMVADTVDHVVPNDVQESMRKHADDASKGNTSKTMASRSAVKETYKNVKDKAHTMEIPPEYKDELITRLRDSVMKFQARNDYKNALNDMFSAMGHLLETSKHYSKSQMEKGKMVLSESEADKEWKSAFEHARQLIENIFNGNSMWGVIQSVKTFINDIKENRMLLAWFQGWKNFIQEMLSNSEYVRSDRFRQEAKELAQQTNIVITDQYKGHMSQMFDDFKHFLSGASEDPLNKEFAESIRQLWADACLDENGNLTLKKDLLDDLTRVIPILADHIAYIPLPKIEYDGPDYKMMMDNVVLKCNGVLPTNIYVDMNVRTDFSIPEIISQAKLSFSHVTISAEKIRFQVEKRTGLKFHESGLMDFDIYNRGVSAELVFQPWMQKGHDHIEKGLDLMECHVRIDSLDLSIYNTENHHLLYKLFKGMIQKMVKKVLEREISNSLRKIMDPQYKNLGPSGKGNGDVNLSMPSTATDGKFRTSTRNKDHIAHYKSGREMDNHDDMAQHPISMEDHESGYRYRRGMTSQLRNRLNMNERENNSVVRG